MLLKVFLGFVALIAAICVVAAFQPSTFRVERSIAINAAPSAVFPRLNDLHQSHEWAPWKEKDPQATYEFTGPAAGVGAAQSWVGNSEVGAGKQTIVESRPNELVRVRLDFLKPFEASCDSTYTLKPSGAQTVVTWTMSGENDFVGKLFCLFMDQDKMLGGEFEKGLANLKRIAEAK